MFRFVKNSLPSLLAILLLASAWIGATHHHPASDADVSREATVQTVCSCQNHAPLNQNSTEQVPISDDESDCNLCRLIASEDSAMPIVFQFEVSDSVAGFEEVESRFLAIKSILYYQGRAPPC